MRLLLAIVVWPALSRAAGCDSCHAREAGEWSQSAHSRSLRPVLESAFYRALPQQPVGEARGGYLLQFEPAGSALGVTARRGSEHADAAISWVFGAGRRAETPVARRGSQWLELRISYYSQPGKFDLTMGHRPGISASAAEAIGTPQNPALIGSCFGCHSTGGLPGAAGFQPGVGCQACHRDAEPHALHGIAAPHPGRLSPKAVLSLCGSCHRADPEGAPDDLINVRYQAVRLQRSLCFASGKLSCLTCHDPHANARSDAAWYRDRCLACHPGQSARGDCLECHMPRVALNSLLAFTDHWIQKQPQKI